MCTGGFQPRNSPSSTPEHSCKKETINHNLQDDKSRKWDGFVSIPLDD